MTQLDLSPGAARTPSTDTPVVGRGAGNAFVDRRSSTPNDHRRGERRQFGSSHAELSDAGKELAQAIDQYKVTHHRRYLTCDEMLSVLADLGYRKERVT